ncbi:MAG: rhodanese-like domain-containing protein [Phycisphaerales bacterium]|nr:rhodanese-like domain-containing protein [Phycisphaerales bacterium]
MNTVRVVTCLGLAAAAALLGACETNITDKDIKPIELAELRAMITERAKNPDRVVLIDPRSRKRFEAERLPGAMNLRLPDLNKVKKRDPKLEEFSTIVVYDNDRSAILARSLTKKLLELEYDDVRLFFGGIKEWKAAGLQAESTPGAELVPGVGDSKPEPEGKPDERR